MVRSVKEAFDDMKVLSNFPIVRCDTHLYIYNDFVTTIMLPRFVDNLV